MKETIVTTQTPKRSYRRKITRFNAIDIYVGKRLKSLRKIANLTQNDLAREMGITFQQVQKYEIGHNRLSASRLWDASQILGVNVNTFFVGMDEETLCQSPRLMYAQSDIQHSLLCQKSIHPLFKTETLELVEAYYNIKNRPLAHNLRNKILDAAKYQ